MNKLCCEINPLYYCGECDRRECKICWTEDRRESHFKFFDEGDGRLKIKCNATGRTLTNTTFNYYGK